MPARGAISDLRHPSAQGAPHQPGLRAAPIGRPLSEEPPTDAEIAAALLSKLRMVPSFAQRAAKASAADGVVRLTGVVANLRERDLAIETAEGLRGVRSVVDEVRLRNPQLPDSELRSRAVKALSLDEATRPAPANPVRIEVQVRSGIATLSGKTQSWAQRQLASWIVKGIAGIRGIRNDLQPTLLRHRADAEIARDIEGLIRQDPWLSRDPVQVRVRDGAARISGVVGSLAEKRQLRFFASVNGVRSVDLSELGINWEKARKLGRAAGMAPRSDSDVQAAVEDSLLADPRVGVFGPRITVNRGIVTLRGTVSNLKARVAAEEDAGATSGVLGVRNLLAVQAQPALSEATIASEVRDSLKLSPITSPAQIQVEVRHGRVTLKGSTPSAYAKWVAQDLAARIGGVSEVDNELLVNNLTKAANDSEIRHRIQQLLRSEVALSPSDRVAVAVVDGVATLRGTVDFMSDQGAAVRNAFEGGARIVHNQLSVRQGPSTRGQTYYFSSSPLDARWYERTDAQDLAAPPAA